MFYYFWDCMNFTHVSNIYIGLYINFYFSLIEISPSMLAALGGVLGAIIIVLIITIFAVAIALVIW